MIIKHTLRSDTELLSHAITELDADVLTILPTRLPKRLKVLKAEWVKALPDLPTGLEELYCPSVLELPSVLPNTLKRLVCNSVIELPELPPNLEYLEAINAINLPY